MIKTKIDIEAFKRQKIREWRKDWCKCARELFGVYLDAEQEAILASVQYNPKTIVSSGTARGKDFVTAVASMSFFYLTPRWDNATGYMVANTKVALTAPTDRQVKNIMMPEISRLYNQARRLGFDIPGRLTAYDIRTDNEEWFLTGFKADEYNHEAWSGFHAVNTMFGVTEGSGIAETIFTAIEGNLQGNSRLLIVMNNNTGTGYAANTLTNPAFKHFRLDSLNAPNVLQKKIVILGQVDWEWVNGRVAEWCQAINPSDFKEEEGDFWWENDKGRHCYRPNDLFRVKVRGMAPKVSSDVLIPREWIEIAKRKYKEFKEQRFPIIWPLRLGIDVAGMGRDSSSFCYRYGPLVDKFENIHSGGVANHMQVTGKQISILKLNTDKFRGVYPQAMIDTIGEGAGVYSRAIEVAADDSDLSEKRIYSVKASEGAVWNGTPLKDVTGQYEFLNMRAYLYWAARDWLNPANNTGAMLPDNSPLEHQLTSTKWFFRSDGKIQIEPKEDIKKRLGSSPDEADAFVSTFYPVPDFDPRTKPQTSLASFYPL